MSVWLGCLKLQLRKTVGTSENQDFSSRIDYLICDRRMPGTDSIRDRFLIKYKDTYPSFSGKAILCSSIIADLDFKESGYDLATEEKGGLPLRVIDEQISEISSIKGHAEDDGFSNNGGF